MLLGLIHLKIYIIFEFKIVTKITFKKSRSKSNSNRRINCQLLTNQPLIGLELDESGEPHPDPKPAPNPSKL